jgi:hypothetical protein
MEPKPGEKLGPYEILSRIGAGGMGQVWKARDMRLDRIVAIPTLWNVKNTASYFPCVEHHAALAKLNVGYAWQGKPIEQIGAGRLNCEVIRAKLADYKNSTA